MANGSSSSSEPPRGSPATDGDSTAGPAKDSAASASAAARTYDVLANSDGADGAERGNQQAWSLPAMPSLANVAMPHFLNPYVTANGSPPDAERRDLEMRENYDPREFPGGDGDFVLDIEENVDEEDDDNEEDDEDEEEDEDEDEDEEEEEEDDENMIGFNDDEDEDDEEEEDENMIDFNDDDDEDEDEDDDEDISVEDVDEDNMREDEEDVSEFDDDLDMEEGDDDLDMEEGDDDLDMEEGDDEDENNFFGEIVSDEMENQAEGDNFGENGVDNENDQLIPVLQEGLKSQHLHLHISANLVLKYYKVVSHLCNIYNYLLPA